jgi:hypothetical protein
MSIVIIRDKPYKVKKGKLTLKNKGISSISEIKGLENLPALKELDLSKNNISEISGLDHLENLYNLNLSNNEITEIKGLNNLRNLRFLRLDFNSIREIKGLESLKNIMTLYLNGNKINEIKGLDNLSNLNALYIAGNNITEVKGIENLHNLKRFDIGVTSKLPKEEVKKLKKDHIHTKDEGYFGKRFAKRFMWYCIGVLIASFLIAASICVINDLPITTFWAMFGMFFILLFIFSPLLIVIGKAYGGG